MLDSVASGRGKTVFARNINILEQYRCSPAPHYAHGRVYAGRTSWPSLSSIIGRAYSISAFVGVPSWSQVSEMNGLRDKLSGRRLVRADSSFCSVNGDRSRPLRWIQRLRFQGAWRLTRHLWLWRHHLLDGKPIAACLAVEALMPWQWPDELSLPSPSGGSRDS